MTRWTLPLLCLAVAVAQCPRASADRAPPDDDGGRQRYHMRQQLDDLRTIERMLVDGKLAEARTLAFFFTRQTGAAGYQAPELRDIVLAGGSLANAQTVPEAIYHEVRIAAACASCHAREGYPSFRAPTDAPTERPTVTAQMARHQWAADRLWEAVIGASDDHWRVALDAIASTQIPPDVRPAPRELGIKLQQQAREARLRLPLPTPAERATIYGQLLVTCATCHAARPVQSFRPRPTL